MLFKIKKLDFNKRMGSEGILFSTDLMLGLLLFVVILGIVANILDSSKEKIINPLEVSELERLTSEVASSLLNNPGTPKHWENLLSFNNVNPGLAIENSFNETIINTVSFKKIKILGNGYYNDLIDGKFFNKEVKSSIGLYPIGCDIEAITIGDNIVDVNTANIVVINRTVKCDFYRDLAIVSIFNNGFSDINGNFRNIGEIGNNENNINSLSISEVCNHEILNNFSYSNLNHSNFNNNINENNDENNDNSGYYWICKKFKITKKDFEEKNYYLIFSDSSVNQGHSWILDDVKNLSFVENNVAISKIDLNSYFEEIFENQSSMIFYLHCKLDKNNIKDFNCVLCGVDKDIDINNLNIDYFKEQDCYFVMKTCYNY